MHMRTRGIPGGLFLLGLLIAGSMAAGQEMKLKPGEEAFAENAYRHYYVLNTVMPTYPAESLRLGHQGVAVAEVRVSGQGRLLDERVLQAPDKAIGEAVAYALKQWRFRSAHGSKGQPKVALSKLTFYFVIRGGDGVVLNPSQMPRRK